MIPDNAHVESVIEHICEALPETFGLADAMAAVRVAYMTGYFEALPERPERKPAA